MADVQTTAAPTASPSKPSLLADSDRGCVDVAPVASRRLAFPFEAEANHRGAGLLADNDSPAIVSSWRVGPPARRARWW